MDIDLSGCVAISDSTTGLQPTLTVGADIQEESESLVDIRIIQRTNRKYITIVEGLSEDLDKNKILQRLRKIFHCNGSVKNNTIQIQGDQRENIRNFLVKHKLCLEKSINLHGF
jgi:translation initiation factor 1